MVSSYPPSRCGVGRFAHALVGALSRAGTPVDILRVVPPGDEPSFDPGVVTEFQPDGRPLPEPIVRHLDRYGSVLVQHEFGLYGPNDGEVILDLVERCHPP